MDAEPTILNPLSPLAPATTAWWTGQLEDASGSGLPLSSIASLSLSLYRLQDGSAVFSDQDVLNVGRGVVDVDGSFTMTFTPTDTTQPASPVADTFRLQAVLDFEWHSGFDVFTGRHSVVMTFRVFPN